MFFNEYHLNHFRIAEKFVIVCIFFVCVQSLFSSTDAVQTAPRQLVAHQIVHDPQN